MTGDSLVSSLSLAGAVSTAVPDAGHTQTAATRNGQDGTVTLNSVLGDDSSVTDKIVGTGDTSGNTQLAVNIAGAQTVNGIEVVQVNGQSGCITAEAYGYSHLKKGADWYLTSLYVPAATPVAAIEATLRSVEVHNANTLTGDKKGASLWLRQSGSGQLRTKGNHYVALLGGDIGGG